MDEVTSVCLELDLWHQGAGGTKCTKKKTKIEITKKIMKVVFLVLSVVGSIFFAGIEALRKPNIRYMY